MDHTLWVYPRDVLDDPAAADEIAALGLGSVSLAASYHSTRTLLPDNPRRTVLVARHAAVYLEPDPDAYPGLRLRLSTPDWVAPAPFVTALASLRGQSVSAWMVLRPTIPDADSLARRVDGLAAAGAQDIHCDHYGLCPGQDLGWIAGAAVAMPSTR